VPQVARVYQYGECEPFVWRTAGAGLGSKSVPGVWLGCYGLISFWGYRPSNSRAQAGAVPGVIAPGGGVVAGAVEDADGEVAEGGEQLPGPACAEPGGVFAEGCVAVVVEWASHCSFTVRGRLEQPVLGGG